MAIERRTSLKATYVSTQLVRDERQPIDIHHISCAGHHVIADQGVLDAVRAHEAKGHLLAQCLATPDNRAGHHRNLPNNAVPKPPCALRAKMALDERHAQTIRDEVQGTRKFLERPVLKSWT